jgi:hypothetical protein
MPLEREMATADPVRNPEVADFTPTPVGRRLTGI